MTASILKTALEADMKKAYNAYVLTWSQTPNSYYNKIRLLIAESTLNYIVKLPDAAIDINQYLVTAFKPNILRRGEFQRRNRSFMEVYYRGLYSEKE